jgi:GAF domain
MAPRSSSIRSTDTTWDDAEWALLTKLMAERGLYQEEFTAVTEDQKQEEPPKSTSMTVRDFTSKKDLLRLLEQDASAPDQQHFGWFLTNLDTKTCAKQDVKEEANRLMKLKSYNVLDRITEDEVFQEALAPEFQRIVDSAKKIFDVPIAVISMIDAGRQQFLSSTGLDASVTETPRGCAFCAHAIQTNGGIMVVPDATQDPRFMNNPLVEDGLKIRFYAGARVTSPEGAHLGTVCVIDMKPRHDITEKQLNGLQCLASDAMREIMATWLLDSI